jgi:sugar/nucleoside kinase (ribokinase family)
MITGKKDVREIIHFFDPYNIPIVGVKLGEKGCYLKRGSEEIFIPPYDVPAVDVSGAGDAFYAGFLYAYLKKWDLETMGKLGNAVAACAIGAIGCTAGVTSVQAAMDIMKNSPVKNVSLE